MQFKLKKSNFDLKKSVRSTYVVALCIFATACLLIVLALKTKEFIYNTVLSQTDSGAKIAAFPIGVNPSSETIQENPSVEIYFNTNFSSDVIRQPRRGWFNYILSLLTKFGWYQNLASPISRILVIEPGERKEQVVKNFGEILHWDTNQRTTFLTLVEGSVPQLEEGKFFPNQYVVSKDASPTEVAKMVLEQFDSEILSRYTRDISEIVPLRDSMTIASLLEKEAYDFEDMRYISGIIWNRLFADMKLQLDASLQYAKADTSASAWWSKVRPNDKYIKSPFNTYKNVGLPPSPIANPSIAAVLASLNPRETECIFYFHDKDGGFHCTKTYEEHVALLKQYYGRGE